MLADFEAGLQGARAGEEARHRADFPAELRRTGACRQAARICSQREVRSRNATCPELDDEFCKVYGVEQGGIDRLRSEVEENMRRELADAIAARVKKQVLDGLLAANPIELPKSMVDAQVRDLQIDAARRMGARDASQIPPPEGFQDAARRRVALCC